MIDLSKVRNYYVACGYTDLRRGIDGLAAIVIQQYGGHLDEEGLFLFCSRRTDRIKALYWSGDGYILLYKRLRDGQFQWPRSEAELLFRLVSERYEHGSIILTSNKYFSDWGELLSDNVIATALLDRLLHHAHVINIRGGTYRLKDRMRAGLQAVPITSPSAEIPPTK